MRGHTEKGQRVRTVQVSVAAAILGTMAVIAGCGQAGPNASGAAGAGGSSSPASASSGSSGSVTVSGKSLTVNAEENGKVFDMRVGTSVFVYLRGTPSQMWKPIRASSDVLRPAASGRMALMLGETGASFMATAPGTATISSTRGLCTSPSPGGMSAGGGTEQCGVIENFRVTVNVTSG